MIYLALLISVLFPVLVDATEYYVATTGSNSNSCVQAQTPSTPKLTISGGVGCLASGDTLTVAAGTYSNQQITNPIAGTASAYTIIRGDPSGARPVLSQNGSASFRGFYCNTGATCQYVEMRYFEVTGAHNSVKTDGNTTLGFPHHLRFVGNVFHDTVSSNMEFSTSTGSAYLGGDHYIAENEFYRTGVGTPAYGPGHNTIYNPGNRSVIERNVFHNLINGVGIWHSNKFLENVIVRYNQFYEIGRHLTDTWLVPGGAAVHVSSAGRGHRIYGNTIYNSGDDSIFTGIRVNPQFNKTELTDIQIDNNSIYDLNNVNAHAIRMSSNMDTPNAVLVRNNIAIDAGLGIVDDSGVGAMIASNNRTTGVGSDLWTSPSTGVLTLKASSAAINAGTSATGAAFCGSSPDQGAFETLIVSAAAIDGNLIDTTICSAHPPIIPGTFTVGCTGTGCPGTPSVVNTSLLGGSGGIVRLETNWTCAAGQTITVSAGATTTDSALVGNTQNQPLHTTTGFPVDSSACDGTGGPSAPVGEVAHYAFDGNLNDSSGNGNTGTGTNISYTTGRSGQGALTTVGVETHIDTGLLSGHNPSATHLVVAAWFYIDPADLGQTKDLWGTAVGTNQQFIFYRHSGNTYRMLINGMGGTASEFPVVSGWTHGCIKMNPTGNIATMYINGVAGVTSGASVITYGSYTLASDLNFGLPSGFATSLSGAYIFDDAYIYTTDVSCTDLFDAGQPVTGDATAVQATHQWQGVFTAAGGTAEDRGAADAQRTVVKGGAGAVMVQLNNTSGASLVLQPRFRYNINGGSFTNVVPDSPTADGVSYWGASLPSGLNNGAADGPISGALAHTDGVTLTTSAAIPTITMANNTSYTLRGIFLIDAAINDVVCFKIYDQGGSELASYTPSAGACLTVIAPQATGGY